MTRLGYLSRGPRVTGSATGDDIQTANINMWRAEAVGVKCYRFIVLLLDFSRTQRKQAVSSPRCLKKLNVTPSELGTKFVINTTHRDDRITLFYILFV